MWLIYDGASTHFNRTARRYLNNDRIGRRIGKRELIARTVHSSDLTPLDFYLRWHLESLSNENNIIDRIFEHLRQSLKCQ